jgi:hypothetical protein
LKIIAQLSLGSFFQAPAPRQKATGNQQFRHANSLSQGIAAVDDRKIGVN